MHLKLAFLLLVMMMACFSLRDTDVVIPVFRLEFRLRIAQDCLGLNEYKLLVYTDAYYGSISESNICKS